MKLYDSENPPKQSFGMEQVKGKNWPVHEKIVFTCSVLHVAQLAGLAVLAAEQAVNTPLAYSMMLAQVLAYISPFTFSLYNVHWN